MTGTEIMEIATATAGHYWGTEAHLIAFAREISKVERERCAKLCDIECDGNGNIANGPIATERGKMLYEAMAAGAANCAAAIRGTK